jgi:hypothetical protein
MDQHFCSRAFEPLRGLVQQLFTPANVFTAGIAGIKSSAIGFGRVQLQQSLALFVTQSLTFKGQLMLDFAGKYDLEVTLEWSAFDASAFPR